MLDVVVVDVVDFKLWCFKEGTAFVAHTFRDGLVTLWAIHYIIYITCQIFKSLWA
jgi:hypothetical protein